MKTSKYDLNIWILISIVPPKLSEFEMKIYSLPWNKIDIKSTHKKNINKQ